ncbi:MAG: DUF2095 family protein [Promethearchaeota archaeon]
MNDNQNKEDNKSSKPIKIDYKDGLNVKYNKEDLMKYYPHLMAEIENKDNEMNIDPISADITQNENFEPIKEEKQQIPKELINPGAIDFIRRCRNEEETFEILDYLLKRNEITQEQYDDFKIRINQEDGLKALIEECGGFKKPGYYEKKYYKKNING